MAARKKSAVKKPVVKELTIEKRIEMYTQQGMQAEQQAANFTKTATKCAGAVEALTIMLNDQKKK